MTPLINCEDSIAASEVARAIFKAEMVAHQRNVCEVHVCLKKNWVQTGTLSFSWDT